MKGQQHMFQQSNFLIAVGKDDSLVNGIQLGTFVQIILKGMGTLGCFT